MVALSTRVLTAESSPNRRREFPIIRLYTPTSRSGQVRITHPIYIPEIDGVTGSTINDKSPQGCIPRMITNRS